MANLVSLIRTLLAILVICLLFDHTRAIYIACFILTIVVISMDALDGYLARKFNESSKTGAVIDILGDRVVEQIYWVTFLALGWLPLWIPLVVIIRGILVDGLRAVALEQGYTAFGENTLQQGKFSRLLVTSNFSRTTYAVAKAAAFAFLILGHTPELSKAAAENLTLIGMVSTYISVVFCVARGLPVLIEGKRFLWHVPPANPQA